MHLEFFKGLIVDRSGTQQPESVIYWATTPFGVIAALDGSEETIPNFNPNDALSAESITSFELPGLDQEGMEVIVTNILTRGYLKKPGVKHKGDAVLFILVNEAIHALSEVNED